MTVRQQSAEKIACRTSVRLESSGLSCSGGNCDNACSSFDDTKSEKNSPGANAKSSAMPPVSATLRYSAFAFSFSTSGWSNTSFKAIIANSGMVNSAITSIDATVRNFAYIGI